MPPNPKPSSFSPSPEIEFRDFEDDAWYTVCLLRYHNKLKVIYRNLPDIHDRVFDARNFGSLDAIQDFRSRFRPLSLPLDDSECGNANQGTLVCASYSPRDGDVCFYDAIIDAVERKEHGKGECSCSFIIIWKHGPSEGKMDVKHIDSVCLVEPSARIDPKVASFLELAMKQMDKTVVKTTTNSGVDISTTNGGNSNRSVSPSCKMVYSDASEAAATGYKSADRATSKACSTLEQNLDYLSEESAQDIDLGGTGKHYMILIKNLEKDIIPSSVVDFLQLQTSLSTRACVFPCLPSESFARGAIFVDSEKDLKKLYNFLENSDQIIVSTRGRPWIATGKLRGQGIASFSALMPKYLIKPVSRRRLELHNGIEVVRLGTEEFKKAKKLKEMFLYFVNKQKKLHERLAVEEGYILKQPIAK